jgi:hypothetical protein
MTMAAGVIAVCPEWHNPAVFIARIGENISPRPQRRYPADALPAGLGLVDNDKN